MYYMKCLVPTPSYKPFTFQFRDKAFGFVWLTSDSTFAVNRYSNNIKYDKQIIKIEQLTYKRLDRKADNDIISRSQIK